MSEEERKLADTSGKFVQVVEDGTKVNDLEWQTGRVLLSNRRLVLVSNEGKRTLALSNVTSVKNRRDVNEAVSPVSGYFSLQMGSDVYLVAPSDIDTFESALYTALIDGVAVLVKHPAVEGGVVQDTAWQKGRLNVEDDQVDLAVASGQFVEIELEDVGTVEVHTSTVKGSKRRVLEVEHTVGDNTSVETHVSGTSRHVAVLESLARKNEQQNPADVELQDGDYEVLMALYSGVSPFEIPDFVGQDVETVEETFDRLVDQGLLERVRTRREVALKARGRNVASEVISER